MAWISPSKMPTIRAHIMPIQGLFEKFVAAIAIKALVSIIPSKPIFITPDLSENTPPKPASIKGIAILMAEAKKISVKYTFYHDSDFLLRIKRLATSSATTTRITITACITIINSRGILPPVNIFTNAPP